MVSITKIVLPLLFVAVGVGLVFAGFEVAAYEQTIADREVTTDGTVTDTNVYQLPDGNWTYEFTYEYVIDQEAEITAQGLEDVYPDEMSGGQEYTSSKSGGKSSSQSSARRSMEQNFVGEREVLVYVDPFNPGDGSLSDATTILPRILQYGGSGLLAAGLFMLARMARRVSA